jgi:protein TonB
MLDPEPIGFPGVYREGDLADSPVVLHFPPPVFPPALRSAGIEGRVRVEYVVDRNGRVEPGSIVVVSTDHPLMAESVRAALLEARFRPGTVGGTPVRALVQQTVRFSLMSL